MSLDHHPDRERILVWGAILTTVTLWASAFVGIRSASQHLAPGALAFGRLAVATISLGVVMLVRRERLPDRRHLVGICAVGVLWFGLYNVVLSAAERSVDAGTAAMLVNVGPILIAILAGIFLNEGVSRQLVAGCAVAFSGVAIIGFATSKHGITLSWGALLCVLAALLYAIAVVIQKPLLRSASALQITFGACVAGMLACSPFAPQLASQAGNAPASSIAWMVYLGVFPMAVGFLTWAYALSRMPAGKLGMSTYLVPPLAILLGWVLLSEVPPPLAYAGGALCLGGVWLSRRQPRAESVPTDQLAPT